MKSNSVRNINAQAKNLIDKIQIISNQRIQSVSAESKDNKQLN